MDGLSKAIQAAGGITKLAEMLDVWPSAITNWRMEDRKVPAEQCIRIEQLTGVTVRELRPDLFGTPKRKGRAA